MIETDKNYYEVLEVRRGATQQEIETAYLDTKDTYSPSNIAIYGMFTKDEIQALHKLIEEAYSVLSSIDKRKKYDATLEDGTAYEENFEEERSKSIEESIKYNQDPAIEKQIELLEDCSGAFLQKVRKYKGISLDEIASELRISKTNILAIEEEDFDSLPVKVFTRGFVVQIAKSLGLDAEKFATEYTKLIDEHREKK